MLVGALGLEPRTFGLKVRCSDQLSYTPVGLLVSPVALATGMHFRFM